MSAALFMAQHLSMGILYGHLHRNLLVQVREGNIHLGFSRRQVRPGLQEVIVHALLRAGEQVHIPEDPAHTEFVLVFHVAAITPLQYQHGQKVLPFPQLVCHIEFRSGMGHLAVSHISAVDPHVEAGIHSLKIQVYPGGIRLSLPGKDMPVGPAGILQGHIGRIQGEGITDIGVLLLPVTCHLPHGRHRELVPAWTRSVVLPEKFFLYFMDTVIIAKIPHPVQGLETV